MFRNARRTLSVSAAAAALSLAVWAAPAAAGLVGTEEVAAPQTERERLEALVARPEVARKLETLGVLPQDARERLRTLTDAEVRTLAARVDALPAGGLSDTQWLIIVLILLLVIAL